MPWLAKLDARAARWSRPVRYPYLALKWLLVALGAYCLVGVYVQKWGWPAALWLLLAPAAYGVWNGITTYRSSTPPPR